MKWNKLARNIKGRFRNWDIGVLAYTADNIMDKRK